MKNPAEEVYVSVLNWLFLEEIVSHALNPAFKLEGNLDGNYGPWQVLYYALNGRESLCQRYAGCAVKPADINHNTGAQLAPRVVV